jgi:hypothetical protein
MADRIAAAARRCPLPKTTPFPQQRQGLRCRLCVAAQTSSRAVERAEWALSRLSRNEFFLATVVAGCLRSADFAINRVPAAASSLLPEHDGEVKSL